MKNVIVPLDLSEDSIKGLDMACLLARKTPINIQMIYVQNKSLGDATTMADEEYRHATKRLKELVEEHKPEILEQSKIEFLIKKGKVFQEVVGQAQALPNSMIVASTHGASGFEELFIGSNAYKIITSTDRPVITIRKGAIPEDIKDIVMPIDLVTESRQKTSFTTALAKLFNARIHVVAVSTSKNKKITHKLMAYVQQVANYIKSNELDCKIEFLFGDSHYQLVLDYADKVNANLISVLNESGNGISEFFYGGYAQPIISSASVPVLTIRAHENVKTDSFKTLG